MNSGKRIAMIKCSGKIVAGVMILVVSILKAALLNKQLQRSIHDSLQLQFSNASLLLRPPSMPELKSLALNIPELKSVSLRISLSWALGGLPHNGYVRLMRPRNTNDALVITSHISDE